MRLATKNRSGFLLSSFQDQIDIAGRTAEEVGDVVTLAGLRGPTGA